MLFTPTTLMKKSAITGLCLMAVACVGTGATPQEYAANGNYNYGYNAGYYAGYQQGATRYYAPTGVTYAVPTPTYAQPQTAAVSPLPPMSDPEFLIIRD